MAVEETAEKARVRARAWYAENKDRHVAATRARRADPVLGPRYRAKQREANLRKKYGISVQEYDEMLEAQSGGCAICGVPAPEGRYLDVDHCHDSGRVRGLLCNTHNRAIGLLQHDVALLEKAVTYLGR